MSRCIYRRITKGHVAGMPVSDFLPSLWEGDVCQNAWGAHLRSSVSRIYFSAAAERWSRQRVPGAQDADDAGHSRSTAQFPQDQLNAESTPSPGATSAHVPHSSIHNTIRSQEFLSPRDGTLTDTQIAVPHHDVPLRSNGKSSTAPTSTRECLFPLKPPEARGPERNKYFADLISEFRTAFRERNQPRVEKLSRIYFQAGGHPFEWMFNARVTLCNPRYHRGCDPMRQVALAKRILAEAKTYLRPSTQTYCALISVCGAAGQPELGEKYLEEVEHPDEFTLAAVISCWATRGKVKKAREVIEKFKRVVPSVQPSTSSYNALLNAYAKTSQLQGGLEVMKEMKSAGVSPNSFTYNTLLAMYARVADIEGAMGVWREMKEGGIQGSDVTRSSLLHAFRKQPNLPFHVWEEMREGFLAAPPPPSNYKGEQESADARFHSATKWARDFFGAETGDGARVKGGWGETPGVTRELVRQYGNEQPCAAGGMPGGTHEGVPGVAQGHGESGKGRRPWLMELAMDGWRYVSGWRGGERTGVASEKEEEEDVALEGSRKHLSGGSFSNGGPPDGVYRVVDLHGFSVIESTLMVMDSLERLGAEAAASGNQEGLIIICGINKGNVRSLVLRNSIERHLKSGGVTCHRHAVNAGRLYISPRNVHAFQSRQQDLQLSHQWRQTALGRFVLIGGAIGAIGSVHHVTTYYASLALG